MLSLPGGHSSQQNKRVESNAFLKQSYRYCFASRIEDVVSLFIKVQASHHVYVISFQSALRTVKIYMNKGTNLFCHSVYLICSDNLFK